MGELRGFFRPEFLNRLDEVLIFDRLSREEVDAIVGLQIGRVGMRGLRRGVFVCGWRMGLAVGLGIGVMILFMGRGLKRVIRGEIEDSLSEEILRGLLVSGDEVVVSVKGDGLVLREGGGGSRRGGSLGGEPPQASFSWRGILDLPQGN